MANYWTRKDDQSEELRTIKPWDEAIAHGNMFWPDKDEENESEGKSKDDEKEQ